MARPTKLDRNGRRPSGCQIRQRQLARLMYVTQGAEANLCSCLATNGTHLTQEEFREANRLRNELLIFTRLMHDKMKG